MEGDNFDSARTGTVGRTPSARVAQRSKAYKTAVVNVDHRKTDVFGIVLIAFGLICFVGLATANSGLLGSISSTLLHAIAGMGAWVVPAMIIAIGLLHLSGRKPAGKSRFVAGLCVGFIAFLSALGRSSHGDFFDPTVATSSGGYLGAICSWGLNSLLGAAKPIGIGALFAISLILCIDMPLRTIGESWARKRIRGTAPVGKTTMRSKGDTRMVESQRTQLIAGDGPNAAEDVITPAKREVRIGSTSSAKGELLSTESSVPKEGYRLPALNILTEPPAKAERSKAEMQRNIETLEGTLEQFGIEANVVEVATGPTVTRYEISLGPGIRVARIAALADNIAMDLAASHVRLEAPIPGKTAIGVEVPNAQATPVFLRELCETAEFQESPSRLCIALGKDVSGQNKYADLTKMPHLLIGGATNSGKSIGLSTIITSLLMRNTPKDVRLVMIDPKRVELTLFDNIPHLMCPVITDVKETPGVLRAVWREMDRRYDTFSAAGVRNIDGWNSKASFNERMPFIVVIIDELADLMMTAAAEVETSICRLAQLARATGIHLVIATQRPSVDVITGTIKANIASRMAFTVSSQIDSRTILDSKGAESLIGRGDMLFLPIDASKPIRIQGCYVSEDEIDRICKFWRDQEQPAYTLEPVEVPSEEGRRGSDADDGNDALWEEAVRWVADRGQASTSMLQRKFSIGFQRASRLLDSMEERGIVGKRDGPRPREVLVSPMEVDEVVFGGGGKLPPGVIVDYDEHPEMGA